MAGHSLGETRAALISLHKAALVADNRVACPLGQVTDNLLLNTRARVVGTSPRRVRLSPRKAMKEKSCCHCGAQAGGLCHWDFSISFFWGETEGHRHGDKIPQPGDGPKQQWNVFPSSRAAQEAMWGHGLYLWGWPLTPEQKLGWQLPPASGPTKSQGGTCTGSNLAKLCCPCPGLCSCRGSERG